MISVCSGYYTMELPIDIYHAIAMQSEGAYRALLALPPFARSVSVSTRYDYMILFGYSVKIFHDKIRWLKDDKYHRVGGPAIEYSDGTCYWFINGKSHRDGGPAFKSQFGEVWAKNDLRHRDDGPAFVYREDREWWRDGVYHRDNGPAIEHKSGYKAWYREGVLHRDNGPAVIHSDGNCEWYRNGVQYQPGGAEPDIVPDSGP